MSKKKYWSECLFDEWDTLRHICKKKQWTENQGVEYMEKKNLILPQTSYDAVLQTFLLTFLHYDVYGKILHLYFIDKELRDFLCSCELMKYDDLKSYIKDNGNFYPVNEMNKSRDSQFFDFPFCIHIQQEKYGYSFNCQIINGNFHLVAERRQAFMLKETEYKALINISDEELQPVQKEFIKLYRLAFNTVTYINCFRDYVKDGVPEIDINEHSASNRKTVRVSKELQEEISEFLKTPEVRSPYIKRGHFMYLKNERYTNKHGQFVWRKPCMVKGLAKTVYTNEELLQEKTDMGAFC